MAARKTCPVTTVKTVELTSRGNIYGVEFELHAPDGKIGVLAAQPEAKTLDVWAAQIDTDYRRCGLGTRLYEAAAKWACGKGLRLQSDSVRSTDSHTFWNKQVAKGRAVCSGPSRDSAVIMRKSSDLPRYGRDNCETYILEPCTTELSGARRK